jgi:hypothetical protein
LEFVLVTTEDEETTLGRLTSESFARANPLFTNRKLTFEQHFPVFGKYVRGIHKQGLSFFAREKETGKIVGGVVAEDVAHPLGVDDATLASAVPAHLDVIDICTVLTKEFDEAHKDVKPGEVYHLVTVITTEGQEGKGIGKVWKLCCSK